jgi:HSP20 family molecular chaperone IbpA
MASRGSTQPGAREAVFENGVLTLTLPQAEETKPKVIKVKRK